MNVRNKRFSGNGRGGLAAHCLTRSICAGQHALIPKNNRNQALLVYHHQQGATKRRVKLQKVAYLVRYDFTLADLA
jgi:hypothetical protein